jgi:transposase
MASLTKKLIGGRPYYYLRECRRVNGKPKIVWQEYIGTPQQLVVRLTRPEPQEAVIREFGAVAAAFDMAEQLGIASTIDRTIPKRGAQGPTVGQYLLVATINRCVAPVSKSQIGDWYEKTILPRLMGLKASQLTSQRFWDNMERVDEKAIVTIERDIAATAVRRFGLDLRCLVFDATNFFTFIDTFNDRSTLAQRGHSKEERDNLRLLGLALLITTDGEVPLMHHTYAGNQHDATTFASIAEELAKRCRTLGQGVEEMTLVFDKGNNSKENIERVGRGPYHFVGSLVPTQHPELLGVSQKRMRRLDAALLPAVWSFRTHKKLFGVERTVLITFNRPLYVAQWKTLKREISKRREKLSNLEASLNRQGAKGKKPTLEGMRNRIQALLAGRHMKDLFTVTLDKGPRLHWSFNQGYWTHLKRTLLGKTLLFTDRDDWSDEQIVLAYRSQFHVECAFRRMKDPRVVAFRPTYHWTDQKLRVHAFYCVLALTILSLMRRQMAKAGISLSISRMIERLDNIREVLTLYATPQGEAPRTKTILSQRDSEQAAMLDVLDLSRYFPK